MALLSHKNARLLLNKIHSVSINVTVILVSQKKLNIRKAGKVVDITYIEDQAKEVEKMTELLKLQELKNESIIAAVVNPDGIIITNRCPITT